MTPIDPRLLRHCRPARHWVTVAAALSAALAGTTVAIGVLIGLAVAEFITAHNPRWDLVGAIAVLATVRGVVVWARRGLGHRAAAQVICDLRDQALSRLIDADPRTVDRRSWRIVLSTGIEGLGPYLTGFLPALASTAISTPAALVAIAVLDLRSAVIAAITVPLIPVFMWLVGTLTEGRTESRLAALGVLSDQLLDLIAGMPTLRALHRQHAPDTEIARLSEQHRRSTMSVLRIAFLSGFVLEFLATLSVALVAVSIGFRLLDGSVSLSAGLAVLIIVPEVYQPLREIGARFHDAQDGLTASTQVLDLLADAPAGTAPSPVVAPELPTAGIRVDFVDFCATGRDGNHPNHLSGVAQPGEVTVLAGANGAGKSTALLAVLGLATQGVSGVARAVGPTGVLSGEQLWQHTSFLPQRPVLQPATIGDSSGLSLGQRQRAAFAEEMARNRSLIIVDEPTAHLDQDNAQTLITQLRQRASAGATVLVASHDELVLAAADAVIEVTP